MHMKHVEVHTDGSCMGAFGTKWILSKAPTVRKYATMAGLLFLAVISRGTKLDLVG